MASLTGNGTTVSFSQGTVWDLISISGIDVSHGGINDDILTTTGFSEMIPQDLSEIAEVTMAAVVDPASISWISGHTSPGTITITFPGGGSFAGTGWISGYSIDSIANNERIEGTLRVQFDGKTGPALSST